MMLSKYVSICTILIISKFGSKEAYLIGERCKYDDDCFVDNSFCEMQQMCECKENFLVSEDGETCSALVGAHCHSKYDCTSLPNSICKEDRCVCDQGYVSDTSQSKCLRIVQQLQGSCENDLQCKARLGNESHCYNRQCQCFPGYHFENKCVASKRLREECRNSSQCYIGDEHRHTISCINGRCSCAQGFHENFDLCLENGSPYQPRSLIVITMCILMVFIL